LLLEGNVIVCSSENGENLGFLGPGDFYGTQLYFESNNNLDGQFFVDSQGEKPPKLKLSPSDNFENRAPLHLIAKTFVTAGYLTEQDLITLCKAFPFLQKSV